MKKLLQKNFNYLSQLSVREYTLYRKFIDIKDRYPIKEDPFFGVDESQYKNLIVVKDNIWIPNDINDYLKIEPELIFVDNKEYNFIWNTLRHFCHSAVWHQSPGRLLRFFIKDRITGKYLGFISLGNDFINVGGRDKYIGWTTDHRLKDGRLRHTAMASTIASVQPFGFNYNGGKLIALLAASNPIQEKWYEKYNEELVGVTTTSLYGGGSMYNRLKYWRKCKSTEGNIRLEPSEDIYNIIKNWYRKKYPIEYKELTLNPDTIVTSHPKAKILNQIYKMFNIKPPVNNAPRGVYWNELYNNTKEFLCMKTEKLSDKKYDNSVESLTELWKERYAKKRVLNLLKDNRFKTDILFYDDMIYNDWNHITNKYI